MSDFDPNDLYGRIPNDVDTAIFADQNDIQVNLELSMKAGLWAWIRAKADYEGITHEEAVSTLLDEAYGHAKRHAQNNGGDLP